MCPIGGPANCNRPIGCTANASICDAIYRMAIITFDYDGIPRVVEPHYYGLTSQARQAVRGYQTNWGGVRSSEPNWHLFALDKIDGLRVTSSRFGGTHTGYNPDDMQMNGYFARVE